MMDSMDANTSTKHKSSVTSVKEGKPTIQKANPRAIVFYKDEVNVMNNNIMNYKI